MDEKECSGCDERDLQLDLRHGAFYEAYRLLARGGGGCVAQAMEELARFLPQEEIDQLRVQRRPCP